LNSNTVMFGFRSAVRVFGRTASRYSSVARQARHVSSTASTDTSKDMLRALSLIGGAAVGTLFLSSGHDDVAQASGNELEYPHYDWPHNSPLATFDAASLRRGFEVYRQVCSTCHSLNFIHFRELVGVTHTKDQATAIAKTYEIEDGPDDKGEMFKRPRALTDRFPNPYPNKNFARFANNGALPPDLSLIAVARMGGPDYLFALLTGYRDPPAGIKLRAGQSYNPYFAGGLISMPPPLSDGQIEYEDGTPATVSQMARDVVCFLNWASEPEHDERKKFGFKMVPVMATLVVFSAYYKRLKWSLLKTRKISWLPVKYD